MLADLVEATTVSTDISLWLPTYLWIYSSVLSNALIVPTPARAEPNCSKIGLFALLSSLFTSLAPPRNLKAIDVAIPNRNTAKMIINGETMNPVIVIAIICKKRLRKNPTVFAILESIALKSAVKRLRIRPKGTVSSHRRGARRTVYRSFWKRIREARSEASKTKRCMDAPRTTRPTLSAT